MGKPVPPAGLWPIVTEPYELPDDDRREIADALGLSGLPPLMAQAIGAGIARYKMQSRLPFVTLGENVAAIDEALRAADAFEKTLRPFWDASHIGVGGKTVRALYPSAAKARNAIRSFRHEAHARKEELRQYGRFGAEHGPLGALCILVRFLFDIVQEVRGAEPKKKLLRIFAREVLKAAGIPCEDYYIHPSRMDKFLFTHETRDDNFANQLRQEIEPYLFPRPCQS